MQIIIGSAGSFIIITLAFWAIESMVAKFSSFSAFIGLRIFAERAGQSFSPSGKL
jgi:hypothetical protein